MAKPIEVYKYDCVADFLERSNIKIQLNKLDGENQATVFEIVNNRGAVEGTLLYVPGVTFKQLKAKTLKT